MTRNARITTAGIAVAGTIAIAIVAGSLPGYACSGQRIGAASVVDHANALTQDIEATLGRAGSGSSAGAATASSEAEQLRAAREMLDASLRALREKDPGGGGTTTPEVQSACM
jgi:hypothetical protein